MSNFETDEPIVNPLFELNEEVICRGTGHRAIVLSRKWTDECFGSYILGIPKPKPLEYKRWIYGTRYLDQPDGRVTWSTKEGLSKIGNPITEAERLELED